MVLRLIIVLQRFAEGHHSFRKMGAAADGLQADDA